MTEQPYIWMVAWDAPAIGGYSPTESMFEPSVYGTRAENEARKFYDELKAGDRNRLALRPWLNRDELRNPKLMKRPYQKWELVEAPQPKDQPK